MNMTSFSDIRSRYDAVVVGARVAGASTAMLLARAGLRVIVLEKSAYGSDTTSTHALMRPGVMQLHRWGVLDRIKMGGTPAIRKTVFHYGPETIEVAITERDGVDALYAPRRTVLDVALVDAALGADVSVVYGASVTEVRRDAEGRVNGVRFSDANGASHEIGAELVIGADGARSSVARLVNAEVLETGRHFTSTIYGYWRGLNLPETRWYFGRDVAAGAIPTNDGLTCVFAGMRPERYTQRSGGGDSLFARVLAETNPVLADAVSRATRVGKLHPFPGRTGFLRKSCGPGWALVGDASCFKDPLTAHGMTDALRDAELLSSAIATGTGAALASYEAIHNDLASAFLHISDEIASFDWDFDRIKALHKQLSRLMNREYDLVQFACP